MPQPKRGGASEISFEDHRPGVPASQVLDELATLLGPPTEVESAAIAGSGWWGCCRPSAGAEGGAPGGAAGETGAQGGAPTSETPRLGISLRCITPRPNSYDLVAPTHYNVTWTDGAGDAHTMSFTGIDQVDQDYEVLEDGGDGSSGSATRDTFLYATQYPRAG